MALSHRFIRAASAAILLGLCALPAFGIIKVDLPVAKMYQVSKTTLTGVIASVDAQRRAIEVGSVQVLKGGKPDAPLRIQLPSPPTLAETLSPGQPVVMFLNGVDGKGEVILHVADTWLLAQRVGEEQALWRTVQVFDGARSFPGRTQALVRIVNELKDGKPGIQDWISHEAFLGSVHKVGDLGGPAQFLHAVDLDGDSHLDLIAGQADGVRVLMHGAERYIDATQRWGVAGVNAAHCAVGDVNGDGRADLLLGRTLFLRRENRFRSAGSQLPLPDESNWLAVTMEDVTGDGRADVVVLLKTGELLTLIAESAGGQWKTSEKPLWKDELALAAVFSTEWGDNGRLHAMVVHAHGIMRYSAAGDDSPPADFMRLTGMPQSAYTWLGLQPLKVLLATALDYDGNGRADFVLVTEGGGVTLANRGFGAFLVNRFVQQQFDWQNPMKLPKLPYPLTAQTAVAPGRRIAMPNKRLRQNLFALRPDGQLYEMDNTRK